MIDDEIKTIVSVQLGIPVIHSDADFVQDLGAESADIVGMVAAVEDKYGIVVDEGELVDIRTVSNFINLVKNKL
jgi:acyl carrier protein